MAVYKRDMVDFNLETGNIHRSFLKHSIGYKDAAADHFGIRVFRDGEPVNLTGISVQGVFMPPQGSPIAITTGNIVSGNEAEVVLPQACYNYNGQFTLAIKLVDPSNAVTGTMRIIDGMVDNTNASGTVAPVAAIPSYQEVLSTYEQAIAAINKTVRFDATQSLTDTQKATARSNISAPSVAEMNTAVSNEETARQNADALKVNISDIENDLTGTTAGKVLDARQGKVLDDKITAEAATRAAADSDLKSALYSLSAEFVPVEFSPTITKGYFLATSTGKRTSGNKYAYIAGWGGYKTRIAVKLDSDVYECWVSYYAQDGNITTPSGYRGWSNEIRSGIFYLPEIAEKFGMSFRRVDQAVLTDSDVTAIGAALSAYSATDDTLLQKGMAADSMAVGEFKDRYKNAENALINETDMNIPYQIGGTGFIIYDTGLVNTSNVQSHTDYIEISNYKTLKYKRVGLGTDNTQAGIAFYSSASEESYISGKVCAISQSTTGYVDELDTLIVPSNAKYIRCSVFTDTDTYGSFEIYGINKTAEDINELTKNTFSETGYIYKTTQVFNNTQMSITDGRAFEGYTGRACTAYIGGKYIGDALKINLPGYLYRLFYYTSASVSTYKGYTKAFSDNDIHIIPNGYMFRIAFYHDPVDSVEFTDAEIENMANAITLYSASKRADYHDYSSVYYAFGDSLTYGYDGDTHTRSENNYPEKIGKMLGVIVNNEAVVGQGLLKNWTDIHTDYINGLDMSDADLITIAWNYNDFNYYASTNFGDYTDTDDTTFVGKYYTIMKEFQQKCPTAQIILITGHGWGGGSLGPPVVKPTFTEQFTHELTFADKVVTQGEMYNMLEKMANLHGWPCVNQAKGCAINQFNCQTLIGDNIHPTNEGYVLYSNVIAARVAGYYANVK